MVDILQGKEKDKEYAGAVSTLLRILTEGVNHPGKSVLRGPIEDLVKGASSIEVGDEKVRLDWKRQMEEFGYRGRRHTVLQVQETISRGDYGQKISSVELFVRASAIVPWIANQNLPCPVAELMIPLKDVRSVQVGEESSSIKFTAGETELSVSNTGMVYYNQGDISRFEFRIY